MVCSAPCHPHPARIGIVAFLQFCLPWSEPPDTRFVASLRPEDATMQEVIANAFITFVALVRRGKMDLAYGSVLGRLAAAQFKDGRRVGNSLCCHEVLSPYAQRLKNFKVDRLTIARKTTRNGAKSSSKTRPQGRSTSSAPSSTSTAGSTPCLAVIARSPSSSPSAIAPPTPPASSA